MNFTFVDPGWEKLKSFENHLFAYGNLFRVLQDVRLTYIATQPVRFEAAQEILRSMVEQVPKTDPGEEVLHYFRLRKAWEAKKYALFSNGEIELLNKFTQQFATHPCQERYTAWRNGEASNDFIRTLCRDLTPPRQVSFQTALVNGQAALFEARPRKRTHEPSAKDLKAQGSKPFSPLFRSDFGSSQEEVPEN